MHISPALLISLGSMLVAIFSIYFTIRLWRKTNRPLVTARISTHSGGNVNIMLDILIENSGTRPALDVHLQAREADIRAAMLKPDERELPIHAKRVFLSNVVVPVVPNGGLLSNGFGCLGQDGVWRPGARIPIKVLYRSMDGSTYTEPGELLLHDDEGFAQTSWDGPSEREIGHRSVTIVSKSRLG